MRGTFWGPGWVVGTCLAQNLSLVLGAPEAAGTVFPDGKGTSLGWESSLRG